MQLKKQLLAERDFKKWSHWKHDSDKPEMYDMIQQTCLEWLQVRAVAHGFKVENVSVDAYQQNIAGAREIRFSTVNFSGELLVTDPERFQRVLFSGLGHAKAFGCGLLLVRNTES